MSIIERDGFLTDDTPTEPLWKHHRFDTAQDRREHVYRMASERREDLQFRIVQSPGGIDFLTRVDQIGRS